MDICDYKYLLLMAFMYLAIDLKKVKNKYKLTELKWFNAEKDFDFVVIEDANTDHKLYTS